LFLTYLLSHKRKIVLIAGQNKYWGTTEEATACWLAAGADCLLIKNNKDDFQFFDNEGNPNELHFEKLQNLQKVYGVRYLIHPYNVMFDHVILESPAKEDQPKLLKVFEILDKKIRQYDLYPLITVHMPMFKHVRHQIYSDEEEALRNGKELFQKLKIKTDLCIETMFDPGKNPNIDTIGYNAEHFIYLIGQKRIGICIDTGHLNMANAPLQDFLKLKYPILSMHIHGNDGIRDKHELTTKENVKNFDQVVEAVRNCKGPIVLEARNYNYSKQQLKDCVQFWKELST
jgi:sugar phosphate isomerase/epimerase